MSEKPFKPYVYQTEVKKAFLSRDSGRNVILQAPTGAGKTDAALLAGFECFDRIQHDEVAWDKHPGRIVYGIPMRSLAHDFIRKYRERAAQKAWPPEWHPTIQTGESPEDPLFEGRVIFATVDQILASFLNIPYGLPKKLDNINAGAMIGSYLIFDEFHLYPHQEMMLTVLAMLHMLKDVSRFMLMSATFSPVFLHEIARILDAKPIVDKPNTPFKDGLFSDVTSVQTQERTFCAEDGPLTAEAVHKHIDTGHQRMLCVCNTVERAQALFKALCKITDVDCRLLHSRFYREDRQRTESFILEQFEAASQPVILVATQVVEVGLDISSDILLTECAPAASLIQRAGRCARRENEKGIVHVFQPYDEDGNINYAPYIEEGQKAICHKTWAALSSGEFNGQVMRFPQEQRLIEITHSEADQQLIDGLERKIDQRIEDITKCMATRHPGYAASLIRTQDTVPLYIHPDPNGDTILPKYPSRREAFNLSKGRISRAMKEIQERIDIEADFLFQGGIREESSDYEENFVWRCLNQHTDIHSPDFWHFVAHPNAVSYSPDIGLELSPGKDTAKESPETPPKKWERPVYEGERYHEHIMGLKLAFSLPKPINVKLPDGRSETRSYTALRNEVQYPLRQLSHRLDLDFDQAERLLQLTLALHDVGKLNEPWQAWSRAWQAVRHKHGYNLFIPLDDPFPLAHTDYDGNDEAERNLQKQLKHPPRGNHAGESAEACLPILWEATGGDHFWMAVTVGSIMRHHTPDVDSAGTFQLTSDAGLTFIKSLQLFGFGEEAENWFNTLSKSFTRSGKALARYAEDIMPNRSRYDATLLYLLFVRTLRLADQRSGRWLREYRHSNWFSDNENEVEV